MSAKDKFHELVIIALEKEGWMITHDPYHIDLGFVDLYIDLGAERLLAAIKESEKIAVEIKRASQNGVIRSECEPDHP